MENTPTPNSEFENYLRKNLSQIDATPDDDLWDKIAAQQREPNLAARRRRWVQYAAAAVLLTAVIWGTLRFQHPSPAVPRHENAGGMDTPTAIAPEGQAAVTPPSPSAVSPVSAATPRTVNIPHFGPRVNAVPGHNLRFKAEAGVNYQDPETGTSITIPAGSLVDQNGQTVRGEVDLLFREYRTIEEFLASGIPMHYTDSRGAYSFNSGGMFEMRVSQNGNLLNMASGQQYKVNFVPTADLENASLYYLDDQTGEWDFVPSAAFGQADLKQPPVVTEEKAIAGNLKNGNSDCKPDPGMIAEEPDPAELVQIGVKTGLALATGKLTLPTWFLKNPYLTDDQLLFRMERGLIRIKKHRDQAQLFFPEDLNNFFTELSAFKDCYFRYSLDSLGGGKSVKGLQDGEYWQRITVAQEQGAACIITLFDGKEGQVQFHATLSGSTENKHFEPEKVIREYQRLRQQRQKDFAERNQALRYFLYSASAFKTQQEWCLSPWEWLNYFEKNHPLMARRYADLVKKGLDSDPTLAANAWREWLQVLRNQRFAQVDGSNNSARSAKSNLEYSLYLSNFGVYNCDQIFRLGGQDSQFVLAGYQTANGKKIVAAAVSLLESRTKVLITLPSARQLLWSPGRKLDVIITDREGRQYHIAREQYAKQNLDPKNMNFLTVQDVTEKTNSPKGWADLLEI